jgi:hypothetical protein
MATIVGGIDINQVIFNEFAIGVMEIMMNWLFENNSQLKKPGPDDLKLFRELMADRLKKKYPELNIELIEKKDA